MYNFRLQNSKFEHLIDDIVINFLSSWNFESMKGIRRKFNPKVDLSKFTSNTKNIEWSYNLNFQPNLLLNFIQSLIMLGLKRFRVVTIFLEFIFNNSNFYHTFCWKCVKIYLYLEKMKKKMKF